MTTATPHVVLMGNPEDGFVVVGPFPDRTDAARYIGTDQSGETMWTVELHKPAKDRDNDHRAPA